MKILLFMFFMVILGCNRSNKNIETYNTNYIDPVHDGITSASPLFIGTNTVNVKYITNILAAYFMGVEALSQNDFNIAKKQFMNYHLYLHHIQNDKAKSFIIPMIPALHDITDVKELEDLRKELNDITYFTYNFIKHNKIKITNIYLYKCSMISEKYGYGKNKTDGYWISKKSNIENPYLGRQMLSCGERVNKISE